MLSPTKTLRHAAALAFSTMAFTMAAATGAHAADKPGMDSGRHAASQACETARQQAWFQRQLRTNEGDTEPLEPALPAACGPMAEAPGANAQAANAVTDSPRTQVR